MKITYEQLREWEKDAEYGNVPEDGGSRILELIEALRRQGSTREAERREQ